MGGQVGRTDENSLMTLKLTLQYLPLYSTTIINSTIFYSFYSLLEGKDHMTVSEL